MAEPETDIKELEQLIRDNDIRIARLVAKLLVADAQDLQTLTQEELQLREENARHRRRIAALETARPRRGIG